MAIPSGVLLPDATALRETAETLEFAKRSGDDLALDLARSTRGVVLLHQDGPGRESGLDLLLKVRERAINQQFTLTTIPITDIHIAIEKGRSGDLDGAIVILRFLLNDLSDSSVSIWTAPATGALVEALLERRASGDLDEASATVERLAAVKVDPGFVLHQLYLLRLRALLAWACGDQSQYQGNRDSIERWRRTWLRGAYGVCRGDAMTTCPSCATELPANCKFCLECGTSISALRYPAEYKQVTVLFADVVHSMDIAAAVGAERLREIMAELLDRSTAVVKRYGGTVNQFTGDGIMAVFGAPITLEDHAFRACLAALEIQTAAKLCVRGQAQ